VGLKENVILGHLVPAGTGFRTHQDAEVRLNAPAPAAEAPVGDGQGAEAVAGTLQPAGATEE
jgi:DNA-directed RNA polymerase subunit beta'